MEQEKLISVIVPVYRVEEYLNQCVGSIVSQTYQNLEILLVDDGSPDGCPELCEQWGKKDRRIRVIHKENGGLSDARNVGIKAAAGELLMFVDSDDWIAPDMAEKLELALAQYDADMALCQFAKVFPDGKKEVWFSCGEAVKVYNQKEALHLLMRDEEITNHVWRRLYKKELFEKTQFPKGKNFEDMYIMADLTRKCKKIVSLDAVGYFYRQNQNGILQSRSFQNLNDYMDGLEKSYAEIEQECSDIAEDKMIAKARTSTYIWQDVMYSKRMTAEERAAIRARLRKWADVPLSETKKLFWRNRIYYRLIYQNRDSAAAIWYQLWFNPDNGWSHFRKAVKKLVMPKK